MSIDHNEFSAVCVSTFNKNGLSEYAKSDVIDLLYRLTVRMLEVNEYMNLTAITDMDGIILKHYTDSLTVSKYIKENSSFIDIGCGAGFPSLVLAIARPDLRITALDSTAKRIDYINETAKLLGLDNIIATTARAEELAHNIDYRERFDYACARAVARLNVLSELCLPYVRHGGYFLSMKANFRDELDEAMNAISKLGGTLHSSDSFELVSDKDDTNDPRCIISIEKTSHSPKNYPRNYSQIKKKPL